MADHLFLPEPLALQGRRQGTAFGSTESREPSSHGSDLRDELDQVRQTPIRLVVEGVDPRRVFKVHGTTRLTDAELAARSLQLLGDTDDWTYVVLPDDADLAELYRAVDAYARGSIDGGSAPLSGFFDRIVRIEPYGSADRTSPALAAAAEEGTWPLLVDIVIWPSSDQEEAGRRAGDVERALEQFGGIRRGSDLRPQSTVVRASCGAETLEAILDLTVVEQVRLPLAPLLEPSSWLTTQVDDLPPPVPLNAIVGVLDDGVAAGHPWLDGVVLASYEFPNDVSWKAMGPHGTMVAGLAAYGGFEDVLATGAHLSQPARIVVARILEPDGSGDPLSTHLPSGEPDHEVIEGAIRFLHEEHGVRVFNLSVADRFPYSGPHASVLTETLDRLVRELDIVVVLAAGNRTFPLDGMTESGLHVLDDYPDYLHEDEARLAEPAAAANALTTIFHRAG